MIKYTFLLFLLLQILFAQTSYFAPKDCNYPVKGLDEKGGFKDLVIGTDISSYLSISEKGECPLLISLKFPSHMIGNLNCDFFTKHGYEFRKIQGKYLKSNYTLFGEQADEIQLFFYNNKLQLIYIDFSYMQNILSNYGEIFGSNECVSKFYGLDGGYTEHIYLRGDKISLIGQDYNLLNNPNMDFIMYFDENKLLKLKNDLENANKSDY